MMIWVKAWTEPTNAHIHHFLLRKEGSLGSVIEFLGKERNSKWTEILPAQKAIPKGNIL